MYNFQEVRADYVWFIGCIKKNSLCSWVVLKKGLNTKDFLLHRNVDCDSCSVLYDCTWEIAEHLFLECPFAIEVWDGLLKHLFFTLICCQDIEGLIKSILDRVDTSTPGTLTLIKLIFPAYVWHIWRERNNQFFKHKFERQNHVLQGILSQFQSRVIYLDLLLPDHISSR